MSITSYKDLRVWQRGYRLGIEVYKAINNSRHFTLRDQIQRSALSVPSNIAEGFERTSNKEYIYHLKVARESCAELRTQLMFAFDVGALDQDGSKEFVEESRIISAILQKLIC